MNPAAKNINIHRIASDGERIYQEIKEQYEPAHRGKFLAIDTETSEIFLGKTGSQAVETAKKKYPHKVFYVVKIGYSATQTLASMSRV